MSLLGADTGSEYSTISSSTGYYVFPSVRPGSYDITVALAGFKTAALHGVAVSVGEHTAQDITLAVGTASETVSVAADDQTLEAEISAVDAAI